MEAYDDFLELSVGSLKDYLNVRGLQTTGRKVELVARAFAACEQNIPIKLTHEQHSISLKAEYRNRLAKYNLSDPNSATAWLDDMTKWPAVDLGKIFSFILTHKEFDSTYVGKYKDQKAFSYWRSNFVGPIYFSQNKDDKCILKSSITPSQRVRQDPHQAWVAVRNNGTIVCGWCTCIAGTSATCNHIIALLYKVNFAVQSGYTDPACTSVPCGWNHSTRKDVQPGKVIEMDIRKDKASRNGSDEARGIIKDAWRAFDPRKEGQREISESKKTHFLNGLAQTRPTAQILKSMESRLHGQPRHKLYMTECAENFSSSFNGEEQEKINGFLATLPLSDEEVTSIEKETRGQSTSTAWKEHRKGRITASNFKEVCTKIDSLAKSRGNVKPKTTPLLAKLVYGSEDLDHVPAIRWGKENEDKALSDFHAIALSKHRNCKLT
ncbi:uncharacterized protein [Montipora foliosa]|uniref:uncharacterized protein n=1 Tax=Montipora foliosa TaxID=591990 RepID=UPI0035F178EB